MKTPILHPQRAGFKIIKRTHVMSGQIMYLQILNRNNSYRGSSEFTFEEVRDYAAEAKWLAQNFAAPTPTKNSIAERKIAPEKTEEPATQPAPDAPTDIKKMSVPQMLAAGKTEAEIMKELNRRDRAKKRPSRAKKKPKAEAKKTTKKAEKKAGKAAENDDKSEMEKLLENE